MTVRAYYCAAILIAIFSVSPENRGWYDIICMVVAFVYLALGVRKEIAALNEQGGESSE